ncbi:hypothetical protein [Edaphobacter modestus]|uniref:hypothetical protein n=1 Tax=Edaphobacter modestus TaxID=388466 RepID=UPI00102BA622|nr:hypothetical protein [Edaphobacter modestus]
MTEPKCNADWSIRTNHLPEIGDAPFRLLPFGGMGMLEALAGWVTPWRLSPSTLEHRIKKLRIRKSHFKLS